MTVDGYSGKIVTITQGDTRYVGEMKDNKMHGRGKLSMRNGFKLEGEVSGTLENADLISALNPIKQRDLQLKEYYNLW